MSPPYWPLDRRAFALSMLLFLGLAHLLTGVPGQAQPAPVIRLTDLATQPITPYDAVYLDGQITAASPLTAFTINGQSLWRQESLQLFFGYVAALQPGANRFVLEATDRACTRVHREVVVHRQVETVMLPDTQLQVMLLPLAPQGEATVLAETASAYLLKAVLKQGRFQVVKHARLVDLLHEQQLSQTALVHPDTAVAVGKVAGAEGVLAGSVTATPPGFTVSIRVVDVETAALLAEESVYGEERQASAMRTLMEGLALKIRQRLPRLRGRVLQVEGEKVLVNLGRHQLQKPMKLLVFRAGEASPHPITGEVLDAPTEMLGEVVVEAIFDDVAQGVLRHSRSPGGVKPQDHVILK